VLKYQNDRKDNGQKQGNCNRNLEASKEPLKSQCARHRLIHERCDESKGGCPKDSPWEAQVQLPESERRQIGVKAVVV